MTIENNAGVFKLISYMDSSRTTLLIDGKDVCHLNHEDLSDLEYCAARHRQLLRAKKEGNYYAEI
ncbi:MAG: hypothetical protein GY821_12820 [Gammaproteobacteria bacterium]|nr:hypothetical protein [Gammaproteobacteria bacterium]